MQSSVLFSRPWWSIGEFEFTREARTLQFTTSRKSFLKRLCATKWDSCYPRLFFYTTLEMHSFPKITCNLRNNWETAVRAPTQWLIKLGWYLMPSRWSTMEINNISNNAGSTGELLRLCTLVGVVLSRRKGPNSRSHSNSKCLFGTKFLILHQCHTMNSPLSWTSMRIMQPHVIPTSLPARCPEHA